MATRNGSRPPSPWRILAKAFGLSALLHAPVSAEEAPNLSLYGTPGHVTMPSALSLPDGHFALSVNAQGETIRRGTLAFQITPRLTGVFRYSYLKDFFEPAERLSLYDRSFDLIYRIAEEDPQGWTPALAVGFQDFGGTGIYGAEYIVASRHIGRRLLVSGGIGWGRLGSYGGFKNPLSAISERFDDRPRRKGLEDTGKLALDTFFRGDAALFFGLDWQASENLRLSAEYSSDAMELERELIGFEHRSPLNFGLDYRLGNGGEIGVAWLHGSTLALSYNMVLNPRRPAAPSGYEPGPPPVAPRTAAASWGLSYDQGPEGEKRLAAALAKQGIRLEGARIEGGIATVAVSNLIWPATAQALGRSARVLSAELPPEVTTIRLTSETRGMPMREVAFDRADLEELEYAADGAWQIWSRAETADAIARPDPRFDRNSRHALRIAPYFEPSFFDPDNPFRFDIGAEVTAEWSPVAGLYFSGAVRQKIFGNLDEATRVSDSVLPHVRSDSGLYFRASGPRIPWATAEYFYRPAEDIYGRFSFGLLEPMFAGASAELLWAPVESRLALGLEINHVTQRDYDGFGFLDYQLLTGHASAYLDLGGGYQGQLDVGRYLAGDWGATMNLSRRFGNGVEVGAFFTLTDVGFDDFGEGAFDKGITITVPLALLSGRPTRERSGITLRPILRDGGARLSVRNRLFELTQDDRAAARGERWARFWR